jgi:putative inorganic carbon (hco3(-)) transporter
MRDVIVTAIIFGLLPLALFEPFVGVALWTWISVMNPHRLTWGFAYNVPFAQVTAIVTLVSLLVASKKVRFPVNAATLTLIALLAWMSLSFLFAIHFKESFEMWSRVSKTLLMTLVALAVVRSEKQIRIFLWIFVMSVAFYGIKGGVFAAVTGGEFRVYGPPDSHIEDNNAISVALVMMIPLMAFLAEDLKNRFLKGAMMVSILLSIASIISSYSRGAFVAGGAMLLFIAIKSRRRLLLIPLFALAIPLILLAMPGKWWDRMATITSSNYDQSVQGRFNAWRTIWNLAVDRPIFGGGFEIYTPDVFQRYSPNPQDIHAAHSIYFQMLGEHGFVGLGLFLLLAALMWRTGSRVIRASTDDGNRWKGDLARSLQVSMIGFLVGGLTVNIAYWDVYYFELVLLVALVQLAVAEKRMVALTRSPSPQLRSSHAGTG